MVPAQVVAGKSEALLCGHGFVESPVIGRPMHPWRLLWKGADDTRPAAEPEADVSGSPDTPIERILALALIDETMSRLGPARVSQNWCYDKNGLGQSDLILRRNRFPPNGNKSK
jgi:hypothetical protein